MRVGSNGITVAQLTKYLADAGMDANTEIYPLGAKAKYIKVDRATKAVVIDEEPLEEYDNLECICDTCDGCIWYVDGECKIEIDEEDIQ